MKPRRRGHRRRARIEEEAELNVNGFMNLMVVLLPFLLTSVVLTQFSVITISLPEPGRSQPPPPPDANAAERPYSLNVRLDQAGLHIRSGESDLPLIPRRADGNHDAAAFSRVLEELHRQHPEHKSIRIVSLPSTPYQELVHVMDAVTPPGQVEPLFTDIQLDEALP